MRTVFERSIKKDFFPDEIGDYELITLWLESPKTFDENNNPLFKQYVLDLIYTNFSIYEDLYSNCLSGTLSILDANHLLSDFPIIGEETVQIAFRSMNTKIAIQLRMRVVGISEIERVNENTNLYTLFLTSEIGIKNLKQKISRSFHSGSLSNIVETICEKYLGLTNEKFIPITKKGEYYIKEKSVASNYFSIETDTGHIEKYVAPSYTPFRIINKLCKRSVSATGSLFFFFQDINRFRFVSLEDIFKNKKSKENLKTLVYLPKDTLDKDSTSPWNIVYDYKMIKRFDVIKNMNRGMYSSEIIFVDLEKRKVETKQYYYQDDAKKYYHINNDKYLLTTNNSDITHNVETERPSTVNELVIFHSGDYESQDYSDHRKEMYQRRMSMQAQLDSLVIQVEIAGDSSGSINVGDLVYFYMPRGQRKEGDLYLTGRYLVTRIHHSVDISEKYKIILEMITDTISTSYRIDEADPRSGIAIKSEPRDIFLEMDNDVVSTSILSSEIVNVINEESRKRKLEIHFNSYLND